MNNNAWEDAYGDETTGPSTVVFFPDMSEFEKQDQNEEENNSNEGIASDWALKRLELCKHAWKRYKTPKIQIDSLDQIST